MRFSSNLIGFIPDFVCSRSPYETYISVLCWAESGFAGAKMKQRDSRHMQQKPAWQSQLVQVYTAS